MADNKSSTMLDETLMGPPPEPLEDDDEPNPKDDKEKPEKPVQEKGRAAADKERSADKDKAKKRDGVGDRIGQLTGEMSRLKTELTEKDKDLDALRDHTRKLQTTVDDYVSKSENKDQKVEVPNPVTNPEEYATFMEGQRKKDREDFDKRLKDTRESTRMETLLEVQRDLHEDYDDVVRPVQRMFEAGKMSEEDKKQVYGARNPFSAAYKFGMKLRDAQKPPGDQAQVDPEKDRKEKAEQERQQAIKQGSVEGAGHGPTEGDENEELSDAEKRVARLMGVTEKQYLKQRKHLRG